MKQFSLKQQRPRDSHKIGQTDQVTLEGRTFEVELNIHHKGQTYAQCERDCPEGWEIPVYELLQRMRNDPKYIEKLNLLHTDEFVQNPDDISRANGYVARFDANSDRAYLNCGRSPEYRDASLGVRYVREIPSAKSSSQR